MNSDPEMERWRGAWMRGTDPGHDSDAAPAAPERRALGRALAEQTRRLQRRRRWHWSAASLFLGGSLLVAWKLPTTEMIVWAATTWAMTLLITAVSWWNWRTLWHAATQPVAAYTAFCRARMRASLREANIGFYFLLLQLGVSVPWLSWDVLHGQMPRARYGVAMASLAAVTVAFWRMFLRWRRKAEAELRAMDPSEDGKQV